jgi:hypothetical protein
VWYDEKKRRFAMNKEFILLYALELLSKQDSITEHSLWKFMSERSEIWNVPSSKEIREVLDDAYTQGKLKLLSANQDRAIYVTTLFFFAP